LTKKWQAGYRAKRSGAIATRLNHLLNEPQEFDRLRPNTAQHACPRAARDAAEEILKLCP
jgi:hypothetical protein